MVVFWKESLKDIQSILICRSCIYKYTYSLKFLTPKSILAADQWSFTNVHAQKNLCCSMYIFPAEVKHGDILPSCFRSYTIIKKSCYSLFNMMFFVFLCLMLVILLFKMVLKHRAEMLLSIWGRVGCRGTNTVHDLIAFCLNLFSISQTTLNF